MNCLIQKNRISPSACLKNILYCDPKVFMKRQTEMYLLKTNNKYNYIEYNTT